MRQAAARDSEWAGAGDAQGMKGRLAFVSPIEVAQFLLLGRKTGVLHLRHDGSVAGRGELRFLSGRVVSAVGPGNQTGMTAAMSLLDWNDGEFQFLPGPVADSDEIGMETENLLLETARAIDEARAGEAEQTAQVTAALEQVDELSRTFAAISADRIAHRAREGSRGWLLEQPGRTLYRTAGHPLMGFDAGASDPEVLDWDQGVTPRTLAGLTAEAPPYHGWVWAGEKRLYLSWGTDSFVLVHPFSRPVVTDHVKDRWMLEAIARSAAPVAVWGAPGVGKSLFLALYAQVLADGGDRVLVLSGIPTHDLGDGRTIHHGVLDPAFDLTTARTLIARWRPHAVLVDHDPCADLGVFLRDCWMAGARIAVTLRAAERAQALAVLEALGGVPRNAAGWRFFAPRPAAPGPILELAEPAA